MVARVEHSSRLRNGSLLSPAAKSAKCEIRHLLVLGGKGKVVQELSNGSQPNFDRMKKRQRAGTHCALIPIAQEERFLMLVDPIDVREVPIRSLSDKQDYGNEICV